MRSRTDPAVDRGFRSRVAGAGNLVGMTGPVTKPAVARLTVRVQTRPAEQIPVSPAALAPESGARTVDRVKQTAFDFSRLDGVAGRAVFTAFTFLALFARFSVHFLPRWRAAFVSWDKNVLFAGLCVDVIQRLFTPYRVGKASLAGESGAVVRAVVRIRTKTEEISEETAERLKLSASPRLAIVRVRLSAGRGRGRCTNG